MYAEERQQAIAALVAERGRMSVAELAEAYDVTTETVRRDLSGLERSGLVRRVHGGAVPAGALTVIEPVLVDRDAAHIDEKEQIAAAALDLLPQGEPSGLIDAGTTTARFAAALPRDRRLTVITHAVPVASRVTQLPLAELHLLPGRVRPATQAAVGADTVTALGGINADIAFVGTNGLSAERGLSTPDREEAATKRALIAAANHTVLLTDSSKADGDSLMRFADLGDIDTIVTDRGLPRALRSALTRAGVSVVIA